MDPRSWGKRQPAKPLISEFRYNEYITLIVAVWYTFTEIGSILENAQKLGAPIPDWLNKGVRMLKAKADNAKGAAEAASQIVSNLDTSQYLGKH